MLVRDNAASAPRDPRRTLTAIGVVVYTWDIASDLITWGPNAAEVFGVADMAAWSCGRAFAEAVEPTGGTSREEAVVSTEDRDEGSGVGYAAAYGLQLGSGPALTADDTGRWSGGSDGRPVLAHGTMRLRRSEASAGDASRDRAEFLAQVSADLAEGQATARPTTMFAIAIANLSDLNDELGFEAADGLIATVLARLLATVRGRDRFVRYSGNRFALALRGCGPAEIEIAAARLMRLAGDEPVGTAAGPAFARLAIGAASAPDHATESGTLLRRAEASLGLAKRRSGHGVLVYDPRLFRSGTRARRDPVFDSIDVLNGRRIAFACQPIVEAQSRSVSFSEALLRVAGEDGRITPAGDIVPTLERSGLVHLADARMLELVTEHLGQTPDVRVSVNVSPMSMERPDWLSMLAGCLGASPGIASRLIVEVTETAAIRDPDATRRTLDTVKALGASVAMDDFGAGHTSFLNLRNFPVDVVKIDGAFVQNLTRTPDDRFFVRTLIDLAHHLGIACVAEWVEDEESALMLTSWGVDFLQGDHIGLPTIVAQASQARPSLVA